MNVFLFSQPFFKILICQYQKKKKRTKRMHHSPGRYSVPECCELLPQKKNFILRIYLNSLLSEFTKCL